MKDENINRRQALKRIFLIGVGMVFTGCNLEKEVEYQNYQNYSNTYNNVYSDEYSNYQNTYSNNYTDVYSEYADYYDAYTNYYY